SCPRPPRSRLFPYTTLFRSLVHTGADRAEASCLAHKIVCRVPAGHTTFGRPAFGRLLAFSREVRVDPARSSPDVLPGQGTMPWRSEEHTSELQSRENLVCRL